MELTVNGEKREVPEGATVSQLLETLQVVPERVVVEVNLTILKRAEYPGAVLKEGDRVEIVRFVGGGASAGCRPQAPSCRTQASSVLQHEACSLKLSWWTEHG